MFEARYIESIPFPLVAVDIGETLDLAASLRGLFICRRFSIF
jgi:hypothetical protein